MTSNRLSGPLRPEALEVNFLGAFHLLRGLSFFRASANPSKQSVLDANKCKDLYNPSTIELANLLPPFRSARQSKKPRRFRHCSFRAHLKRMAILVPCFLLMALGMLHLLETLVGRARLLWNFRVDQAFPLSWGRLSCKELSSLDKFSDAVNLASLTPCHSHHYYWRPQPLLNAINLGCTGVEADIWEFDEELYVGHSIQSLSRNNTFHHMYVQPLVDILDSKGSKNKRPATIRRCPECGKPGHNVRTCQVEVETPDV